MMTDADKGASYLEMLRDVYTPQVVEVWPVAPGWWVLAGLLLLLLFAAWLAWFRGRGLRRAALRELAWIRQQHMRDDDRIRLAMNLSVLLRRITIAHHPLKAVAGLNGDQWLTFLDSRFGSAAFTQGAGQVLVEAPYAKTADYNAGELMALVESWIIKNT